MRGRIMARNRGWVWVRVQQPRAAKILTIPADELRHGAVGETITLPYTTIHGGAHGFKGAK